MATRRATSRSARKSAAAQPTLLAPSKPSAVRRRAAAKSGASVKRAAGAGTGTASRVARPAAEVGAGAGPVDPATPNPRAAEAAVLPPQGWMQLWEDLAKMSFGAPAPLP